MPVTPIVFKPKYNGSMRFAFYLWPVWLTLFLYFVYRTTYLRIFNPDGFLMIVFGIMTISMPFRVFREMHFTDQIVVKRYILPDVILPYKEIIEFNNLTIKTSQTSVSLFMMDPNSFKDLEQIIQKMILNGKINLSKKKKKK
jgi:hypothetical protein